MILHDEKPAGVEQWIDLIQIDILPDVAKFSYTFSNTVDFGYEGLGHKGLSLMRDDFSGPFVPSWSLMSEVYCITIWAYSQIFLNSKGTSKKRVSKTQFFIYMKNGGN